LHYIVKIHSFFLKIAEKYLTATECSNWLYYI